jgi:hypothetical protein
MNATRLTQRVLLALICCLAIIFLPLSGGAQGILKKGVEGVQKGVETGAEKTKEGAEAVGHGVKKAVTGEDTSTTRMKQTEPAQTTAPSEPATRSRTTAPSQATAGETGKKSSSTKHARAGGERLPATAGELPLIALIGVSALAASGTTKLIRRARAVK